MRRGGPLRRCGAPRLSRGLLVAAALCALPAHGHNPNELTIAMIHAMTPIDSMLTKQELEVVFADGDALSGLTALATDPAVDFGVQLRAIRALPQFCAPACAASSAHGTIVSIIQAIDPASPGGPPILRLRAAIEALGVARSGDPADVALLVPFLDNASRDIRAAAARGLRDLCDPQAIVPLRARLNIETVAQVEVAIEAALRDLGPCSP